MQNPELRSFCRKRRLCLLLRMHDHPKPSQIQGFFSIIDKYIKSNDFTPLHHYLTYLESGTSELLFKSCTQTLYSRYTNNNNQDILLAQKTYKFILCIDFTELSSLDVINKSIEKFFDKLNTEYADYIKQCTNYEPKIYLTVLLWHPTYFKNIKKSFTILIHSKFLFTKTFFSIYAAYIYEKLLEFKAILLKLKHNDDELTNWLINNDSLKMNNDYLLKFFLNYDRYIYYQQAHSHVQGQQHQSSSTQQHNRTCLFETLIFYISKIFKYYSNQEYCNLNLVYITNGLLYTTDIIRQLEFIVKANLTISFICLSNLSDTNCSFGYTVDYNFMRFLARITGGFYAYVNDYLEYHYVENNQLLLSFRHSDEFLNDDFIHDFSVFSSNSKDYNDVIFSLDSNDGATTNTNSTKLSQKRYSMDDDAHNLSQQALAPKQQLNFKSLILAIDENYSNYYYERVTKPTRRRCDQYLNSKLISRYEIQRDLYEIIRLRIREAFSLRKICFNKKDLIAVYMLRYYTQTCCFLYKISYSLNSKRKLQIELWLVFNYLNIKSIYQNTVLLQSIRNQINQIHVNDTERRFDVHIKYIPDILQLKEPLFVFKKVRFEFNSRLIKASSSSAAAAQQQQQQQQGNASGQQQPRGISNKEQQIIHNEELVEYAQTWHRFLSYDLNSDFIERYYNVYLVEFYLYDYELNKNNFKDNFYLQNIKNQADPSDIFLSKNLLNKLYKHLNDCSNVVLVENEVYLKYLYQSTYDLDILQQTASTTSSSFSLSSPTTPILSPQNRRTSLIPNPIGNNNNNNVNVITAATIQQSQYNSFLIIHLNVKHLPYGSFKFIFHPNVSYTDCKKIIEKHKKNLKNLFSKFIFTSSSPLQPQSTQCQSQPQPQSDTATQVTDTLVTDKDKDKLVLQIPPHQQIISFNSIQFFKKQNLYEQLERVFFYTNEQYTSNLKMNLKYLNTNNDLLNFMFTNKYYWNLIDEQIKDNFVDILIKIRFNEGFKCIFYSNKFMIFVLELNILDYNEQHKQSQAHSQCHVNLIHKHTSKLHKIHHHSTSPPVVKSQPTTKPLPTDTPSDQTQTQTDHQQHQHHIKKQSITKQTCTIFYIIHFLDATSTSTSQTDDDYSSSDYQQNFSSTLNSSNKVITEIYIDALDGTLQLKHAHTATQQHQYRQKEKFTYYDNLKITEFLNLIHLIDLKSYQTIQSIYKLTTINDNQATRNGNIDCRLYKKTYDQIKEYEPSPDNYLLYYENNDVNYNNNARVELNPSVKDAYLNKSNLNEQKIINFEFTLNEILRESSLVCCVYDDIPFNMHSQNDTQINYINGLFATNLSQALATNTLDNYMGIIRTSIVFRLNELNLSMNKNKAVIEEVIGCLQSSACLFNCYFNVDQNNNFYIFAYCFLTSGKLIVFLLNCMPMIIKESLVNNSSDIYIFNKYLFQLSDNTDLGSGNGDGDVDGDGMDLSHESNEDGVCCSTSTNGNLDEQLNKYSNLSKLLKSMTFNLNSIFYIYIDYIEKLCSTSYLNSILTYLGKYSLNVERQANELNKDSINYLLRIAKKHKLFDLNISEFYKTLCIHYKRLLLTHNETLDDNCLLKLKYRRQYLFNEHENSKAKQFNKFLKIKNNKNRHLSQTTQQQQQQAQKTASLSSTSSAMNENLDFIKTTTTATTNASGDTSSGLGTMTTGGGVGADLSSSIDDEYNYELDDLDDDVFNDFPVDLNDCKCKYLVKTNYFNLKFQEIFKQNLKLLNGFNDLFMLTSSGIMDEKELIKKFQILNLEYIIEVNEIKLDKTGTTPAQLLQLHNDHHHLIINQDKLLKQRSNTSIDSYFQMNMIPVKQQKQALFPNQNPLLSQLLHLQTQSQLQQQQQHHAQNNLLTIKRNFNDFNLSCFCNLLQKQDLSSIKQAIQKTNLTLNRIDIKVYLRFNWYSFNLNLIDTTQTSQSTSQPPQPSQSTSKNSEKASNLSLISPLVDELKWHLNNEILQHKIHLNNLNDFNLYIKHIDDGCKRNYEFCKYKNKEIIFNTKFKVTDEHDQQFKFIPEFLDILQKLKGKFYSCNLQKLDNYNYFLNCFHGGTSVASTNSSMTSGVHNRTLTEDSGACGGGGGGGGTTTPVNSPGSGINNTFKILIRIIDYHNSNSKPSRTPSPTMPQQQSTSSSSITAERTSGNDLQRFTQSASQQMAYSPRTFSMMQHQRHLYQQQQQQQKLAEQQQKEQQQQNQFKIKLYFNFNHFYFSHDLCNLLTKQFFFKIERIINSVYLKLILKDIDDLRKWNNHLELNENSNSANNANNDTTVPNSNIQTNFQCDCVWSVMFKLHRLHQTTSHKVQQQQQQQQADILEQLQSQMQSSQGQQQSSKHCSIGLLKLKECLTNFRIDDTPKNNDIYVYKRGNDIYLLTLKEMESTATFNNDIIQDSLSSKLDSANLNSTTNDQAGAATGSGSGGGGVGANVNDDSLLNLSHSIDEYEQHNETTVSRQSSVTNISRRQSCANVDDLKSRTSGIMTASITSASLQQQTSSYRPDSVKLSVYGLNEPDEELKQELCKSLQNYLDHSLLIKICSSIEKNSYKTTSIQHPDRLLDEDIVFLKQISDSYIDLELPIPFIFNLNKKLRDYFFYYIRHIFNINFKAMDVANTGLQRLKSTVQPTTVPLATTTTSEQSPPPIVSPIQENLAQQQQQQQLFSFVSTQQSLGSPSIDQLINTNELQYLSRIFFHNNTKFTRIGKNTSISLVLVECLYAPRGVEKLTASKVIKSPTNPSANVLPTLKDQHIAQSVTNTNHIGPSILFRFYCRGDYDLDNVNESLKAAINESLLLIYSNYMINIDNDFYTSTIQLNRAASQYRYLAQQHKQHQTFEELKLNDEARCLKFGNTVKHMSLTELNAYLLESLNTNQIDLKVYQETIEHLYEFIPTTDNKPYDYYRVFDFILNYQAKKSVTATTSREAYSKTSIYMIYEWLRALYQIYKTSQNQTTQQLLTRLNSNPSPTSISPYLANSLHLIYRKEYHYRTRYNLISQLRDFESYLRDSYKCDLHVNYYSFNSSITFNADSQMECLSEDFVQMKEINFSLIDDMLVKKQNLIAIFNVDFRTQVVKTAQQPHSQSQQQQQQQQQQQSSLNTSMQSNVSRNYQHKTMSSQNKLTEQSQSSSLSSSQQPQQLQQSDEYIINFKKIFCFILIDCQKKFSYFYLYTTDNQQYDILKQYYENSCEIITQRYSLVNNIVLYKLGGLIGDQLFVDIKNFKNNLYPSQHTPSVSTQPATQPQTMSNVVASSPVTHTPTTMTIKTLSRIRSPTITRQFTYPAPLTATTTSTTTTTTTASTTTATTTTATSASTQPTYSLKQFCLNQTHNRSYDSVVNILNQQIYFFSLTLPFSQQLQLVPTLTTSVMHLSTSDLHHVTSQQNLNALYTKSSTSTATANRLANHLAGTSSSILFGVGMHVHLLEQQQIYRHSRKIYELALTLAQPSAPQPHTTSSTTTTTTGAQSKSSQLNTSDFYKAHILPVINSYHYCVTPTLFFLNWSDYISNDHSQTPQQQPQSHFTKQEQMSIDTWYRKMRQHYLTEYGKFFEAHGFVRLKDDRTKDTHLKPQPSQQLLQLQPPVDTTQFDNQLMYFIKWIPNDGFIFLTLNFDEIFLHCKLGYYTRYRTLTRTFSNELNKFLHYDLHIHSLSYDYHLLAVNLNFAKSTALQSTLAFQTLQRFLDDFNEYYRVKVPQFSIHKIFKQIYEKYDCSLIPHKIGLIFDFILNLKQKQETITFIPIYTNLDNNIAIYNVKSLNSTPNTNSQTPISCSPAVVVAHQQPQQYVLPQTQAQLPYFDLNSQNYEYTKYLIVKIETNKASQSGNKTGEGGPNNPMSTTLSTSSSSSSLHQIPQSQSRQQQQQQQQKSKLQQLQQQQQLITQSQLQFQLQPESVIRIVYYFLCVNKQHANYIIANNKIQQIDNLKFEQHLNTIKQMIEESLCIYKREIFWDNLTLALQSSTATTTLTTANTNVQQQLFNNYSIQYQELEYILSNSYKINALDLDKNLYTFLKQLYKVKDKVISYFQQNFDKYFIYVQSNDTDYCLLLLTNNFIMNIKDNQKLANIVLTNEEKELNSFILLKFDKLNKFCELLKINRLQQKQDSVGHGGLLDVQVQQHQSKQLFMTQSSIYDISQKHFNFIINTLIYIVWENLF